MMKTDDSILEVCFLIRSYGKRWTGHVLHSRSDPTGSRQPLQHLDTQKRPDWSNACWKWEWAARAGTTLPPRCKP